METEVFPNCPRCGSSDVVRAGWRASHGEPVQRWRCEECYFRFSERKQTSNTMFSKNRSSVEPFPEEHWNENMLSQVLKMPEQVKQQPGRNLQETQGKLLEFSWKMKKKGLKNSTITNRVRALSRLAAKSADLLNPDSVETVLATEDWKISVKKEMVSAYRAFCHVFKIDWDDPVKVHYEPKQPFIPLETEIDQLIAACGKRTGTFLQVLKDTGARTGEACKLRWTDVDSEHSTISINQPLKGSRSRTVKVTAKTIAMINAMPRKYGEYIFSPNNYAMKSSFYLTRNRLAMDIQNPRIRQIHFHTLRHWKATMEYQRSQGKLLYVQEILGHKKLENTAIYTHLIHFEDDEWHSQTAKTVDEARKLIEAGFEYHCVIDGVTLFRKRK